jgi:hypothetical protein
MAASGNYTLALTVNEGANASYGLLQSDGDGETLSGTMFNDFKRYGNLLLKEWQSHGLHLWSQTEGTLFLRNSQEKYDFRLSATKFSNEWFETTTTADTTAGAFTFLVTSATDIQADDKIGIIQNDNDLFWTTVVRKSGLTITVKDAITLATVSGAQVRNYRDTFKPISRVPRNGIRRREDSDYEIPIIHSSRKEYFNLPNKSIDGTPIQAYYDRQDIAGEKYGVMYLWSPPVSSIPVINFTYERKLQIMTLGTETIDIPEYAQEAFIFSIAEKLIFKYGASPERSAMIRQEAFRLRENMFSFDSESAPLKVEPKIHA